MTTRLLGGLVLAGLLSATLALGLAAATRAVVASLAPSADEARAQARPDPELIRRQQAIDRRLRSDDQILRWRRARQQHMAAGAALEAQGEHRAALEAYDRVLELFPHDEKALQALARCWLALGQPARALPLADKAAKVDPREMGAFRMRAQAAAALGDLDQALADLAHVIRIMPQDTASKIRQADLYERARMPHHALHVWARVLESAAGDASVRERADAAIARLVERISTGQETTDD